MTAQKEQDRFFMARALSLAARGGRAVRPNPRVGAVLVQDGRIIASGYHSRFGGPHAEARVLKKAGGAARGGVLYVSLEPCSTRGKTPPCTAAIIAAGVRRVVIACGDRNPINKDRAAAILKREGIEVTSGVREEEASDLNRDFFTYIAGGRPYTTLKLALSLDGKIATRRGDSRWISSPTSRGLGHYLRSISDAVLVGAKTVIRDDPLLTVRMGFDHPGLKRVILEGRSPVPLASRVFAEVSAADTILATSAPISAARQKKLARIGVTCLNIPSRNNRVDLALLFRRLTEFGVMRLLVEGGSETAASVLEAGLIDEVHFFIAPIIIGGRCAFPAVGGRGVNLVREAFRLQDFQVERIEDDIHISGRPIRPNSLEKES